LAAATKEIAVAVAEPIRCFGVDEAGRAFVSFAAVAEENALEVVLEDSIALAALAAEGNYFLYTVEEHLIDDWFVSSGVDLAFVDDAADVVAVLQHPMQPLERDGSFGEVACCACGESEVGHGGFQSFESVLAGGIQFEGLAHQRSTFGVDLNRIEIPFLVTDLETSELVKTSANAFLATKISFINAMAEVCEVTGADVSVLADAIGHDARIGRKFLNAGIGFGGGCLPKDIRAFMARAGELGASQALTFLREVDSVNMRCRARMMELTREVVGGSLIGARVAVLGAAFKPESDDVRDSPALNIAGQIQLQGASVTVYDPKAMDNSRALFPTLGYANGVLEACRGADVTLVLTEWRQFRELEPADLDRVVRQRSIIDGRNCLDREKWRAAGWVYRGVGRP
jgi:hypothetical protein